jgi:hypothetical protein
LKPAASVDLGTRIQGVLAPVRERHAVELRREYPWLDDRRLALLSEQLAQIEVASGHLDRRGIVTDKRTLELRPIVHVATGWRVMAWKWLSELERARARGDRPAETLESIMAEYAAKEQQP